MRALVLAAVIATPALSGSQSFSDDIRLPEFEGGRAVLRIIVMQPTPWANHEITFYAPAPTPGADPLDGPLSALIVRTDGPYQAARSATCAAIREALLSFRELPDLDSSPPALNTRPSLSLPIEPTKKDGASYRFKFEVALPNGHQSLVTLNDYEGDYAVWADRTLGKLKDCWTSPYPSVAP